MPSTVLPIPAAARAGVPPARRPRPRAWLGMLALAAPCLLALPAAVQPAAAQQTPAQPAPAQSPAASDAGEGYTPEVGQPGKDVIWVPTPEVLVEKMLDMAQVSPQDRLMDLGSGDGRTVIAAARRGLTAKGIEYNPDMVELARRNARQAGVADRATFERADLFETDLSQADVITLYLLPSINEKLSPRLLALEPGTRIVSHAFGIGDWEPDRVEKAEDDCPGYCTAYLWVVPARVAGAWQLDGRPLVLKQRFQMLEGTLDGQPITEARMEGRNISFSAGGVRYSGTVNGERIEGTVPGEGSRPWTARRG